MKGLENVASLGIRDFKIHFGEDTILCNRFEASFLSPRITSALLTDSTITEYEIEVETEDQNCFGLKTLKDFFSLSRNGSVEINSSNFEFLKIVGQSFGNEEFCEALMQFTREGGELTMSTVTDRLSIAEFLEVSPSSEIEYLASHFYEIDLTFIKRLSHDNLKEIVGSEKLEIVDEDSLLNIILELGRDYFDLLGHVRSEYLSQSGIDRLLTTISISDVDCGLWSSLCRRLRLFVEPPSNP
jgi:hypothetical protein